jgi:hypothetical protein
MAYPSQYPPARAKNRTCLIVGCVVAALGGLAALCCLTPVGLGFFAATKAGAPAQTWLTSVSQGQIDQAGAVTVGGADRARELAAKIEAEVGRLESPTSARFNTSAQYNNDVGRIKLPISGAKGKATAVFEMEKHEGVWKVKDITFEPASASLTES